MCGGKGLKRGVDGGPKHGQSAYAHVMGRIEREVNDESLPTIQTSVRKWLGDRSALQHTNM